jgi:hypothetical protein
MDKREQVINGIVLSFSEHFFVMRNALLSFLKRKGYFCNNNNIIKHNNVLL